MTEKFSPEHLDESSASDSLITQAAAAEFTNKYGKLLAENAENARKTISADVKFQVIGSTTDTDTALTDAQEAILEEDLLCEATFHAKNGEILCFVIPGNNLVHSEADLDRTLPLEGGSVPMDTWVQLAHRKGNEYHARFDLPTNEDGNIVIPALLEPFLHSYTSPDGFTVTTEEIQEQ